MIILQQEERFTKGPVCCDRCNKLVKPPGVLYHIDSNNPSRCLGLNCAECFALISLSNEVQNNEV